MIKPVDITHKQFRPIEFGIERGINLIAFVSVAFIVLIFVFVFREAASIFFPEKHTVSAVIEQSDSYGAEMVGDGNMIDDDQTKAAMLEDTNRKSSSISDLFGMVWQPISQQPKFGILPLFLASLKVALIAILIGAPIAVFAALYISTFAPGWVKEIVKPTIELLAGFPSVVIGFFALIVLASFLQNVFGIQYRLNAFVGGLALAIAVIPIVFTITEDALSTVPRSYVEASLALGAEKWETALFVVLPAATPGIFAAVLLGMGRAIGETMIVLMATGNAALISINPFDPVRTMAATIGAEMAEVVFGEFHYSVLFFIGVLLFAVSFILNFLAETVIRTLLMRRFKGA